MKRTGELKRTVPPARRTGASRSPGERRAPRDTGLTPEVRRLVLERDGYLCICCGSSIFGKPSAIHLRKPEHFGGSATPENLITVLHACGERISFRRDPLDEA